MRALLFETVTGKPVMDLQRQAWEYDTGILAMDRVVVDVPAYTSWASTLDLRSLLVRDKYGIALIDESVAGVRKVPAAGVIASVEPVDDVDGNHFYKVTCFGPERLLEYRHVRLFPGWPLLNGAGKPTGMYDQNFSGVQYGTIMKRLVSESEKFPGGGLPIVFEPDRSGTRVRNYAAVDGHQIAEVLDQLADLDIGVEYDFRPEIDELDFISWRFVTGTDSGRVIASPHVKAWNLGGAQPNIRNFSRTPSTMPVITDAVLAGGKDEDRVLFARAQDYAPLDEGFPRAELWDTSHSSVSVQSTLQAWANASLGARADQVKFDIRAEHAHGLRHGDLVELAVWGHWDLPNGEYDMRVLSVGRRSDDDEWVSISLV